MLPLDHTKTYKYDIDQHKFHLEMEYTHIGSIANVPRSTVTIFSIPACLLAITVSVLYPFPIIIHTITALNLHY